MTAAIVAAVIFFLLATLPPRPIAVAPGVDAELQRRTIAGAYHIHSTRSDGAGDTDAIAAAAERAGLAFVILTDHGDATRQPDAPVYLHHVLCIDAVEISTNGGHYVALDMPAAPYPLGGEPAAVVEDVRRLGGFGIAAHPDSPRPELAWRDWTLPIDGLEWLSADSEWRDETRARLARVLFDYVWRPAPALASMLDRPVTTLERWDKLAARRPVVAMAGHDAHGGIGRGIEPGGRRRSAFGGIPSYEASFRTFSTRVILANPPSGDAATDARQLLDAIRHGRVFTVIDAIASPGFIDFRVRAHDTDADMGSVLPPGVTQEFATASLPAGAHLVLSSGGHEVDPTAVDGQSPGHYEMNAEREGGQIRVEVRVPGAPGSPPVPWLLGNPIYFLPAPAASRETPRDGASVALLAPAWHVEKDPQSRAALSNASTVTLNYTLGPGARNSQFVAAVLDLRGAPKFSRLIFSASADHPARMSVQVRYGGGGGMRWGRSVYVDSTSRESTVPTDRLIPMDNQSEAAPDSSTASSLLFVIDLTNAKPGDSNALAIRDVRFGQ